MDIDAARGEVNAMLMTCTQADLACRIPAFHWLKGFTPCRSMAVEERSMAATDLEPSLC